MGSSDKGVIIEQIERVKEWLETEEAQESLREAHRRAQDTIKRLQEARKISWQQLHEPFTI